MNEIPHECHRERFERMDFFKHDAMVRIFILFYFSPQKLVLHTLNNGDGIVRDKNFRNHSEKLTSKTQNGKILCISYNLYTGFNKKIATGAQFLDIKLHYGWKKLR